jgi:plastocyanin
MMRAQGEFQRNRFLSTMVVVLFVAAGCGGDGGGDGAAAGGSAVTESPVDAATAGHISGSVSFSGAAPSATVIDMSSEPVCAEQYSSPPVQETVKVNENGTLANVFVYVKEGLGDMRFPVPQQATVIDQQGCRYIPHVSAVRAGQTLTFRNSDGIMHNVNASPSENRPFNFSQPVSMDTNRTLNTPEVMIPIRCDVHGWMNSYVGVVAHPFHSVSNEEGTFDLSTLPPGDYVLEAWHERYGTVTQNVTVATGETAEVTFDFDEGMAANAVVPLGAPIDPHGTHALNDGHTAAGHASVRAASSGSMP